MSFDNFLVNMILLNSDDPNLEALTEEWSLYRYVDAQDECEKGTMWSELNYTCLCGHHPLRHLYYFVNNINGNEILLGSECFKIFNDAYAFKDISKFLEGKVIRLGLFGLNLLFLEGFLNEKDYNFYKSMNYRRKFSERQQDKMDIIEGRIRVKYM